MGEREAHREELAVRMAGLWNDGDVDAFAAIVHPDFELVSDVVSRVEGEGAFRGREGLLRYREAISALVDEFRLEFVEFHHAEDRVLAVGEVRFRARAEASLDQVSHHVIDFRGDVPVRDRTFMDRDEAMRALNDR
jgi:ketosteroid isomerase-like protein